MLKIKAIQIKVQTDNGDFESSFEFDNGLNIIKGNNTSGKSTLFQAILYGLGMEELLEARMKEQCNPSYEIELSTQKILFMKFCDLSLIWKSRTRKLLRLNV